MNAAGTLTGRSLHEQDSADSPGALQDPWRSGDELAFRQMVQRFQGPLLSYVVQHIRNLQDAEDTVQDSFLRAHRSLHQLRDKDKLWEWLKQIGHNVAMDFHRQERRRGIPTDPETIREMGDQRQDRQGDDLNEADPPSLQAIVDAIEELPETYRQVAVYRFLQEWSYAKISETLGLDPAAVRQRISRASRILRTTLSKNPNRKDAQP